MKILVFEFITGGGLNDRLLPENLVREGRLMLNALVKDLADLPGLELYITRDYRLSDNLFPENKNINWVDVPKNSNIKTLFKKLCLKCDLVWPIAPESDGILAEYCRLVEATNAKLLNSSALTVELTGNKLQTFEYLSRGNIPIVSSIRLSEFQWRGNFKYVIKPIDGVGCESSHIGNNNAEFEKIIGKISNPSEYIIQPFMEGRSISLSCLVNNQRAWLICCNEQIMKIQNQQFLLTGCTVNIKLDNRSKYDDILNKIAGMLPDLWGYVGIDLIETRNGPMVLEINPRLTTSYVGIKGALGINFAENVLQMLNGDPIIRHINNHTKLVEVL